MKWGKIVALLACLTPLLGAPAAAGSYGGNCALYARNATGIQISGDAGQWWAQAESRYERGHEPAPGAVLVFRPSRFMHHGHVAVVSRIVNAREILVDQANWVPGHVHTGVSVVDASPANDWSSVRVLELHSQKHGRESPTFGFIYPQRPLRTGGDTVVSAVPQRGAPTRPIVQVGPAASGASVNLGRPTGAERPRDKPPVILVSLLREKPSPAQDKPASIRSVVKNKTRPAVQPHTAAAKPEPVSAAAPRAN